VHVTGTHHNKKRSDIDQIAAKFVDDLKAAGHTVNLAHLVVGGEYDLAHQPSRFPVEREN
jgi:hypothetical protein